LSDVPAKDQCGGWADFDPAAFSEVGRGAEPELTDRDPLIQDWPHEPVDELLRRHLRELDTELQDDHNAIDAVMRRARLLVAGHAVRAVVVADGLRTTCGFFSLLASACEVATVAADRRTLIAAVLGLKPDLIIVGAGHLPQPDDEALLAALRKLAKAHVLPILVLGAGADHPLRSDLFEQLDEPAPGTDQAQDVLAAIHKAMGRYDELAR